MAYIEPNSTIILLGGVPFDPTYENTMFFDDPEDQYEYFVEDSNGLTRITLSAYSYARKSRGSIKVEKPISDLYGVNYMMYKNTSFENKWFFAFVTSVEYINNVTTLVNFDIDVIQSWLFDIDFNECWIERQHSETDAVGDNIIDEGLETGEYVYSGEQVYDYPISPVAVAAVTEEWDSTQDKFVPVIGSVQSGKNGSQYFTGCIFKVYDIFSSTPATATTERARLAADIEKYTEKNKINAIVSLFIGPGEVFGPSPTYGSFDNSPISQSIKTFEGLELGYFVDGYAPHNMKLMCYPFNYMQVSNGQGDVADFRYEFFSDPVNITFKRYGSYSANPAIILWASNYKGLAENYEEVVTNQCYPQCSFNNDTYKAWLAQNKGMLAAAQIGIAGSLVGGIASSIAGVAMGGSAELATQQAGLESLGSGTKGIIGGLTAAAALLGKMYDHSTLPPTQHGSGNTDLMYMFGRNGFAVYHKSIRHDFAERIDKFFDMYGYKVSKVDIPNLNVRPCYTYVKTAGCSLKSKDPLMGYREIPADDARFIESLFDKGMRFWKADAVFGSYDYEDNDNSIQGGE